MRLAESVGVPIPQTLYLDDASQIERGGEAAVVSDRREAATLSRAHGRWLAVLHGGICVECRGSAPQGLRLAQGAYPLILQEKIAGPGIGVFLCVHQGITVALF